MQRQIIDQWWSWIVPLSWQLAIWVAFIAGIAWVARRANPQVRYLLWTLVLVKVFLPPSLAVNWGFGTWGLQPIWDGLRLPAVQTSSLAVGEAAAIEVETAASTSPPARTRPPAELRPRTLLFAIWLVGAACVVAAILWQYRRLLKQARMMELIDEGPVRIALAAPGIAGWCAERSRYPRFP